VTNEEQSRSAGEILAALRPKSITEVPWPGEAPASGTPAAADHAIKLEQYVEYILAKPSAQLTASEREFLGREIRKWSREERHP
jgi:hypothetical protein